VKAALLGHPAIRYVVVGGLGTATHLALLAFSVERLELPPLLGAGIGFLGALGVSFWLNHHWTFRSQRPQWQSLWRYVSVCVGGLLLNTAMMFGLVNGLGWGYFQAQLSVILVVPAINFLLHRHWAFASKADLTSRPRPGDDA
jgi:putative flippase GtrA